MPTAPSWWPSATRLPERAAAAVAQTGASRFTSLEAMLAEVDADIVVLTTPSGLHPQQAIRAARAGRHVLSEKPMATKGTRAWRWCASAAMPA